MRRLVATAWFGLVGCTAVSEDPGPRAELDPACLVEASGLTTIDALVAHIDALPRPVTIPCVLASLPRPLSLVATTSEISVQPAEGPENPRLFVLTGDLILSVVPVGDGSRLLEFSEVSGPVQSIKGELEFPIEGPIAPGAAYELGFEGPVTRCGLCHADEVELVDRPGVFASEALRPATASLVPVDSLFDELAACDWAAEAERCTMLSALLDFGEVEQGAFPEGLPTIFD